MKFGEYLKLLRLEKEISLRSLAKSSGIDVGNLSKIERSVLNPPQNEDFIDKINKVLKLNEIEKKKLIDLASSSNGEYPMDIKNQLADYNAIPILLRTISNKRLSDDEIISITEKIKKEY